MTKILSEFLLMTNQFIAGPLDVVHSVAEALKEYSMTVLNGFQQFLDEVESALELKMSEYGNIFDHADEDYDED